uniref:Uncharacterized protein n=1 Tax=Rhipicephalus microplus TaxID=6941 RepID=A0A6G5AHM6_RHIMP
MRNSRKEITTQKCWFASICITFPSCKNKLGLRLNTTQVTGGWDSPQFRCTCVCSLALHQQTIHKNMFLYSSYAPSASLLLATQQQVKQMRELSNMSITLQHWQTKNTEII